MRYKSTPIRLFALAMLLIGLLPASVPSLLNPPVAQAQAGDIITTLGLGWLSRESSDGLNGALGDMNNDGYLDIAITDVRDPARIYLGDAGGPDEGAFWESAPLSSEFVSAYHPAYLDWGDVDNDGDLDLIGLGLTSILIYHNTNGKIPTLPTWQSADTDYSFALLVGDLDGDSYIDILQFGEGRVNIFRNNNGEFTELPTAQPDLGNSYSYVDLGDIDNDGDLDIAAGGTNDVTLYRNEGNLQFTQMLVQPTDAFGFFYVTSVMLYDYDQDGDNDLTLGSLNTGVGIWPNVGGQILPVFEWRSLEDGSILSLDWGDIDGDGDADLMASGSPKLTHIYRNNKGKLNPRSSWFSPDEVDNFKSMFADLDGDGDLDVLSIGGGRDRAYFNSSIAFSNIALPSLGVAPSAQSAAWGDVDGDGDLDLAMGNIDHPLELFENRNGNLSDTPIWTSEERITSFDVAFADVDDDSDLDLIAASEADGSRVYRNLGTRLERTPMWRENEDFGSRITTGDIDNDGDQDLIIASYLKGAALFRNIGGTFSTTPDWQMPLRPDGPPFFVNAVDTDLRDYNNDGRLDLFVGIFSSPEDHVRIYLNTGSSFANIPVWSSPSRSNLTSFDLGDVNGDGRFDMVIGYAGEHPDLFLNTPSGFPPSGTSLTDQHQASEDLKLSDLDGDGRLDLVMVASNMPSVAYRNTGNGFASSYYWKAVDYTSSEKLAISDMDDDGDNDIVISSIAEASRFFRNNGGIVEANSSWNNGNDPFTEEIAWGDYNNDGWLDVALSTNNGVRLYRNVRGTIDPLIQWDAERYRSNDLAWGDLDGDGDLDLVLTSNDPSVNGSYLKIYRNSNGMLETTPNWEQFFEREVLDLALGDVDNDGDLDLAFGERGYLPSLRGNSGGSGPILGGASPTADSDDQPGYAKILPNINGSFATTPIWQSALGKELNRIAWGDIDNDGKLDLAIGADEYHPIEVYRNAGTNLETKALVSRRERGPTTELSWADGDNDGDSDLAIATSNGPLTIYRSNGTTLESIPKWLSAESVGMNYFDWGDIDNDGDLDIVVGGSDRSIVMYQNRGPLDFGRLSARRSGDTYSTNFIHLYDIDRDGDLDISLNNTGYGNWTPLQVLWGSVNDAVASGGAPRIAVQRPGNEWASGTANSGEHSAVRIFDSKTITVPYQLFDEQGAPVSEVSAEYSLDGFVWHPAVASSTTITRNLSTLPEFVNAPNLPRTIPAGGQGALELSIPAPISGTAGILLDVDVSLSLKQNPVRDLDVTLVGPDGTRVLLIDGQSPPSNNLGGVRFDDEILQLPVPVTSTASLTVPIPPREPLSKLDGKSPVGTWRLEVRDRTPGGPPTQITNWQMRIATTGVTHEYVWDVVGSGVFGSSNQTRLRFTARSNEPVANREDHPQREFSAAYTEPFSVRGSQIQVIDTNGAPMEGAIVYRLADGAPFAPNASALAFQTDANGFLEGRGAIAIGDELIALAPISSTDELSRTHDRYITNMIPERDGVSGYTISATGLQELTVSYTRPLLLFNLLVSLEWDARKDERFMSQLEYDLERASEFLFDASNGQIALGYIDLYHDKENWDDAHIRIYATNRLRPNAAIGGVASDVLTHTLANGADPLIFAPGQLRMGATWNRFGNAGSNLSEDWPRTLAHELAHYLLFVDDTYVGFDSEGRITQIPYDACPGLTNDPYASLELHPPQSWLPGCGSTFAHKTYQRSDWETVTAFYPIIQAPTGTFSQTEQIGPRNQPLNFTEIFSIDPLTPTTRLDVPIFYTIDEEGTRIQPGPRSRAYLFQDTPYDSDNAYDRITPLGRATLDQVLARGARVGDRLCVFEDHLQRLGCETISANDEQIQLNTWGSGDLPSWQPDVTITPVTSRTLTVAVSNLADDELNLRAQLFPIDATLPPTAVTLSHDGSGTYSNTVTVDYPVTGAYIHVWVEEEAPRREAISTFALGGNAGVGARTGGVGARTGGVGARTGGVGARTGGVGARTGGVGARTGGGFLRAGNAPVSSAEGDVLLSADDVVFEEGQFMLLQSVNHLPPAPEWASTIGSGWRFTTSATVPDLTGIPMSFAYLGSEVPTDEESGISVYFMPRGTTTWQQLATSVNTYQNIASTNYAGPGLYVLMSSIILPLSGPGWDLLAYPIQGQDRTVASALAAISGKYERIYGYDSSDRSDPWKVYSPSAPEWVNQLTELEFGKSYWINLTASVDGVPVRGAERSSSGAGLEPPPATIYGTIVASAGFTPTVGMTVTAHIDGNICGTGRTQRVDEMIVYSLDVAAASARQPGCGTLGRTVGFSLNNESLPIRVAWQADSIKRVDLSNRTGVYLPLVK